MKGFQFLILLLTLTVGTLMAEETKILPKGKAILKRDHYHVLTMYPTFGLDVNYESVFKQKHGVAVGGLFNYFKKNTNYDMRLYYRRYVVKENLVRRKTNSIIGTVVKGFGPMLRYTHIDGGFLDEDKVEYNYTADYFTPGIHYIKRRIFNFGLFLDLRAGYGFPIEMNPFTWDTIKPSEGAGLTADITRAFSGFDIGVTLGFAF